MDNSKTSSEEPFNVGLNELSNFLGEQMSKLEQVRKELNHKANARPIFRDYSGTMWKWCLNWAVHPELPQNEGIAYDNLMEEMGLISPSCMITLDTEQNIKHAAMAFNLMMNNYEGAFDMDRSDLFEITGRFMKEMPLLHEIFQLWIYG